MPFAKYSLLRRHMVSHTGCEATRVNAAVLRNQLVNATRAPTGRRYSRATKLSVMRNYKSRRQWDRTRQICPLPLPSLRSVMGWKNTGDINSGVDQQVLVWMNMAASDKPGLRHGLLTFDEVYVNSQPEVQTNSLTTFGIADDAPNKLAKTVLVFQYIGLFSQKRFLASVAWYGCSSLDAATLRSWLFDVMLQLEFAGFRVHGLVCDGHPVNRRVQKKLVLDCLDAGHSENGVSNFAVTHPTTSDPTARLFIFSDPSHVLKRLRNCWYNRDMVFTAGQDACPIKWSHLEAVRDWQNRQLRVDRRLTNKHLELDDWGKMSVQHAVDVFSEPIQLAVQEIDPNGTLGTILYMEFCREFWKLMNNRRRFTSLDQTEYTTRLLSVIAQTMREWEAHMHDKRSQFLTMETYEDLLLLCDGVPAFIRYIFQQQGITVCFIPKTISQDPLERTFGALRQRGGGTQHITVKSIAYNLRTINYNLISRFLSYFGH